MIRVSSFNSDEPHFGSTGSNRFDAPGSPREFGVCYLGTTLEVAIAESILHDEEPDDDLSFKIARTTLESKFILDFTGTDLHLANMTGVHLKTYGGNAGLSGTSDYAVTQQ